MWIKKWIKKLEAVADRETKPGCPGSWFSLLITKEIFYSWRLGAKWKQNSCQYTSVRKSDNEPESGRFMRVFEDIAFDSLFTHCSQATKEKIRSRYPLENVVRFPLQLPTLVLCRHFQSKFHAKFRDVFVRGGKEDKMCTHPLAALLVHASSHSPHLSPKMNEK